MLVFIVVVVGKWYITNLRLESTKVMEHGGILGEYVKLVRRGKIMQIKMITKDEIDKLICDTYGIKDIEYITTRGYEKDGPIAEEFEYVQGEILNDVSIS